MLRGSALLLAILLASCDGSAPADAGADSGPADSGPDSGLHRDSGPADAGSRVDSGPDGGGSDAGDAGSTGCVGPPGLYVEGSCTELAEGVRPFRPQHELWSDGDDKERFVYLPPGTEIDTSDPDRWAFPLGTRLYKTFSIDGLRLETRLLEKVRSERGYESWTMVAYAWSADQQSVSEVGPFGEEDVLGTGHDIPTLAECVRCHSLAQDDTPNGFSAIQLNHDEGGVTLSTLIAEGWLSDPIAPGDAHIPGDETARAALGYLHSNCGSCHGGPEPERGLDMWLRVGPAEVETTPTWQSMVCVCSGWVDPMSGSSLRIEPGDPASSVAVVRMGLRTSSGQMPPIGTKHIDEEGIRIVSEWIRALDPADGGCPRTCE